MLRLLALVTSGCVVGSADTKSDSGSDTDTGTDTDTGSSTDSGITANACPLDVAPIRIQACVETTAVFAVDTDTGYYGGYGDVDLSSTGLVTEVGGVLAAVADSLPVDGFQACGATYTQQVRLVDDQGDTWTIGWALDSDVDDGSASAIVAGSDLDFTVIFRWGGYSAAGAVLLSDAVGPVFLFELEPELEPAERGDIDVTIDTSDSCLVHSTEGEFEHYLVTFDWGGGQVALRSGQSAQVPLPTRELELTLGASQWMTGCLDGCGQNTWAAWAEAP